MNLTVWRLLSRSPSGLKLAVGRYRNGKRCIAWVLSRVTSAMKANKDGSVTRCVQLPRRFVHYNAEILGISDFWAPTMRDGPTYGVLKEPLHAQQREPDAEKVSWINLTKPISIQKKWERKSNLKIWLNSGKQHFALLFLRQCNEEPGTGSTSTSLIGSKREETWKINCKICTPDNSCRYKNDRVRCNTGRGRVVPGDPEETG